MRTSAKVLAKRWGINVEHALYREDGRWYHHLKRFPGALLDSNGYLRFETEGAYRSQSELRHGADLNIPNGIRTIRGYIKVEVGQSQGALPNQIDRIKYQAAYRVGVEFVRGGVSARDIGKQLKSVGLNPTSAHFMVFNLANLLRGRVYKRAMNVAATDDFLTWIRRDFGDEKLRLAAASLRQHIDYYERKFSVKVWGQRKVLEKHEQILAALSGDFVSPEEISSGHLREGRTKTIEVNVFERSARARRACLNYHGTNCAVCSFSFATSFGTIGEGFIHVHHLRDLASIGEEYEVDPKYDLCPVCPNCHAMLHQRNPPFSPEELRAIRDRAIKRKV